MPSVLLASSGNCRSFFLPLSRQLSSSHFYHSLPFRKYLNLCCPKWCSLFYMKTIREKRKKTRNKTVNFLVASFFKIKKREINETSNAEARGILLTFWMAMRPRMIYGCLMARFVFFENKHNGAVGTKRNKKGKNSPKK